MVRVVDAEDVVAEEHDDDDSEQRRHAQASEVELEPTEDPDEEHETDPQMDHRGRAQKAILGPEQKRERQPQDDEQHRNGDREEVGRVEQPGRRVEEVVQSEPGGERGQLPLQPPHRGGRAQSQHDDVSGDETGARGAQGGQEDGTARHDPVDLIAHGIADHHDEAGYGERCVIHELWRGDRNREEELRPVGDLAAGRRLQRFESAIPPGRGAPALRHAVHDQAGREHHAPRRGEEEQRRPEHAARRQLHEEAARHRVQRHAFDAGGSG